MIPFGTGSQAEHATPPDSLGHLLQHELETADRASNLIHTAVVSQSRTS